MSNHQVKKDIWQAAKFTLFSISAGIIQEGSFLLLYNGMHLGYGVSYFVSLVLSVLWNFTLNRRYTFRSDANLIHAMLMVALFYAVFTPLTTWGGAALERIGWNGNLVQILTMLLNFVTEYFYQRFVVYRGSIDTNDIARKAEHDREEKN